MYLKGDLVSLTTPIPDNVIDLSHERCPNIVVGVIGAMRALEVGEILQVIATDLSAPSHIAAWSRQSGQKMIEMYREDDCFVFYLQRCPEPVWHRALAEAAGAPKQRKEL